MSEQFLSLVAAAVAGLADADTQRGCDASLLQVVSSSPGGMANGHADPDKL
jgi:hypothetical protein